LNLPSSYPFSARISERAESARADRVAAIKLYVEITDGSDQGADLAALLAEAVAD